jgi:hypothetical protein
MMIQGEMHMNENQTALNQDIIRMEDVAVEPIEWLWYPYIPYGKLTILQGDPGCGKTMLALDLAAVLSMGGTMPFTEKQLDPTTIIYQTSEDGLADTIKPRLLAAGADCSRVRVINEDKYPLYFDDPRIEKTIVTENARLLILDPLSAYIGQKVSLNEAVEVRNAFRKLYSVAQRTNCAVLIISHMNKSMGINALYRTNGSIDVAGAVRSILTTTKYKKSPTQRVIIPIKSNLAAPGKALVYNLSDHIEWLEAIDADPEELVNGYGDGGTTKTETAMSELTKMLLGREIAQQEVINHFESMNISRRTVEQAKKAVGAKSVKRSDAWFWTIEE